MLHNHKFSVDCIWLSGCRCILIPVWQLPYTLATEEAERIGLDHVARLAGDTGGGAGSRAGDHLAAQHSAVKMLASRVKLVLQYCRAVERGELEHNHEIMRQVILGWVS